MANSCLNRLLLTGDTEKVEAAKAIFKEIEDHQQTKKTYHLPAFIHAENSFMWNIAFDKENIRFNTKESPNLGALQHIADHFGIGFVNHYEELHSYIYGEATYENGLLSDIALSPTDFAAYHYDQKQKVFIYEDKAFEWEEDVIRLLFENKKKLILDRIAKLSALDFREDKEILFRTESNISKDELSAIYGPLLEGHLLLKFAEHKNFDRARALFEQWDEHDVGEMDMYLLNNYRGMPENFETEEKYIAHAFLQSLVDEWDRIHYPQITPPSPGYPG